MTKDFPDPTAADAAAPDLTQRARSLPVIGWREWLSLPDLGISTIKVKVDTGARTSALHAFDLEYFERDGQSMVQFAIHPFQRNDILSKVTTAALMDEREVRSSNGQSEIRPVVTTLVQLGDRQWPIELTLTNRDAMGFRMLLGRQALQDRFLVDPSQSYLQSRNIKP